MIDVVTHARDKYLRIILTNSLYWTFVVNISDDHSNIPVGVTESSNWCGYSTSSYSPNAAPLGGGYAAYPDAAGSAVAAMDASSASELILDLFWSLQIRTRVLGLAFWFKIKTQCSNGKGRYAKGLCGAPTDLLNI